MSAKVAIVAGAGGARGQATAATLAVGGRTVVAAGRNEQARRDLPDGIRAEAAATDPAAAAKLIDRIAGQAGPPASWSAPSARSARQTRLPGARDAAAHARRQPGTRAVAEPGGSAAHAGQRRCSPVSGRYCRRTALKQDPAYMLRRQDRGQFPDGLRLPVERHADAA